MNVYSKLQKCRVLLQKMNLKKSGENKFAGYDYFELQDFLPPINELFMEEGLFGQVSYTAELASLTIINTDKPEEQIVFTSPMASANLKGCHDIQNMGAVETYQRRYLYTTALEIVEKDALDKTTGKDTAPSQTSYKAPQSTPQSATQNHPPQAPAAPTNTTNAITDKQLSFLMNEIKKHNIEPEAVKAKFMLSSARDIKKPQFNEILTWVQAGGDPIPVEEPLPF